MNGYESEHEYDPDYVYSPGETDTEDVDPSPSENLPGTFATSSAVVDPFNGQDLPRGILQDRTIKKVVASFFSPFERERFFQIVWTNPIVTDTEVFDTTWCGYSELYERFGDSLGQIMDEDGRSIENYCFKSVEEFMFFRRLELDLHNEGESDAAYNSNGRCNAMIWSEKSPRFGQRCPHHCVVSHTSSNYIPYCAQHHHAVHSPSSLNRKRFYRGRWLNFTMF